MKNKKFNFLHVAAMLFSLVLISVYPIGNLYARYIEKDQAEDSSVVAKFDVTESFETSQTFPIKIKPGESVTRKIIVNNNSDVAVNVSVNIENKTQNLPLSFVCEDKALSPHTTGEVIIIVNWDSSYSSPEYAEMVDVIVFDLTAQQID